MKFKKKGLFVVLVFSLVLFFGVCLNLHYSLAEEATEEITKIDNQNFPDEVFREYISENADKNKDGFLTKGEIDNVLVVRVSNLELSDLHGIELFTSLKELYCEKTNLETLNISSQNLKKLLASNSKIKEANISCPKLETLDLSNNGLHYLDLSKNTSLKNVSLGNQTIDLRSNGSFHVYAFFYNLCASFKKTQVKNLKLDEKGGGSAYKLKIDDNKLWIPYKIHYKPNPLIPAIPIPISYKIYAVSYDYRVPYGNGQEALMHVKFPSISVGLS